MNELNNKLSQHFLEESYCCFIEDDCLVWTSGDFRLSIDKKNRQDLLDNIECLVIADNNNQKNLLLVSGLKKFSTHALIYCCTNKMLTDLHLLFTFLNLNHDFIYQAFVHYLNTQTKIEPSNIVDNVEKLKNDFLVNTHISRKNIYDQLLLFYIKHK